MKKSGLNMFDQKLSLNNHNYIRRFENVFTFKFVYVSSLYVRPHIIEGL